MDAKQISLTLPENLFNASKKYSEEFGYRNLQEFILDLIRGKVVAENVGRYKAIEGRMKQGIGVRRLNQKDAVRFLHSL